MFKINHNNIDDIHRFLFKLSTDRINVFLNVSGMSGDDPFLANAKNFHATINRRAIAHEDIENFR